MTAPRVRVAVLVLAAGCAAAGARAADPHYTLELPDGDSAGYTLEIDVQYPGTLAVRAEWDGRRIVSMRLAQDAAGGAVVRRSGPSPLELETEIPADATLPARWTLQVRTIPARGSAQVDLGVRLPGPPPPPPPPVPPSTEPPRAAEPWAAPLPADASASPAWERYRVAAERLRESVVDDPVGRDTCRWQEDLVAWLRAAWERRGPASLEPATRDVVADLVAAARSVESMRTSVDPLLAGPIPADPVRADAWIQLRSVRVQEIEARLDRALTRVLRGHAPELERRDWPLRYVSCLTACERYFEERVRLGDARAANRDLTRAQWDRLLLAADALDALTRAVAGRTAPSEARAADPR